MRVTKPLLKITRDRILLTAGWLAALMAAVGAWGSHAETLSLAGNRFGGTQWARALLALHATAILVLLALPVLIAVSALAPGIRSSFMRWCPSRYRQPALAVALAAIAVSEPSYLFDIGRLQFTATFLINLSVVVAFLLLFVGTDRMGPRVSILTITWILLLTIARQTLVALVPLWRVQPHPGWVGISGLTFAGLMIALMLASFLAAFVQVRNIVWSVLGRLQRLPFPALALPIVLFGGMDMAVKTSAVPSAVWALDQFGACLALLAGCVAAMRLASTAEPETLESPLRSRSAFFWLGLGTVTLLYSVQAVRIGINGVYYLNPDGVAYYIIARDLARGVAAIRGYWSPLMPIMLAGAIRVGLNAQAGQRILAGASGLVWVGLTVLMGKRVGLRPSMLVAVAAAMAIISLEVAFYPVTPDILGAVILSGYFLLVTSDACLDRPLLSGMLTGLIGSLAFYAKFYNLPFFLVHLLLTGIFFAASGRPVRKVLSTVVVAWITAAVLVAPWVLALRARYGILTLTTSGPINHALFGPSMTWHPCWDRRLCATPKDVLVPWEDPQISDYADVGWSPFASRDNLLHQIHLTQENIHDFATGVAFELGPVPPLAVVLMLLCMAAVRLTPGTRFYLTWSLMTILLYVSGYLMFLTALRYMLPIIPIAVVGGYRLLQAAFDRLPPPTSSIPIRLTRFAVLAAATLTFVNPVALGLRSLPPDSNCLEVQTLRFADKLVPPIAGSDAKINLMAFYTEKRTLGVLPPTASAADADAALRQMGVRTYVIRMGLPLADELHARGDYPIAANPHICGIGYLILRTPVP